MKKHWLTKIAILTCVTAMTAFTVTACGNKQETAQAAQEAVEQAGSEAQELADEAAEAVDQDKDDAQALADDVKETVEQAGSDAQALADEARETVEQAQGEAQAVEEEMKESMLAEFTGEMDLSGSWNDEVSKRATMDVTANDDGSYDIVINWAGSATEKAVWQIHGTYDPASGMLSYEDGAYSVHTWDAGNNETVSDEEVTQGALMKEGDKLRWSDSKNSEDGLFVKG